MVTLGGISGMKPDILCRKRRNPWSKHSTVFQDRNWLSPGGSMVTPGEEAGRIFWSPEGDSVCVGWWGVGWYQGKHDIKEGSKNGQRKRGTVSPHMTVERNLSLQIPHPYIFYPAVCLFYVYTQWAPTRVSTKTVFIMFAKCSNIESLSGKLVLKKCVYKQYG